MALAPLPYQLPGKFFVLEYNKDAENFVIYTDDEDCSSYTLGGDLQAVRVRFRIWIGQELGDKVIDTAKEFRLVQCIPAQNRIINLFNRESTADVFARERENDKTYITLRR